MTTNFVVATGLCRLTPAEYEAQWNGRPLRIMLDTAATLKLMGTCGSEEKAEILTAKAGLVAGVAQRLIDLRLEKPDEQGATVMISALDLEKSFSDPEAVKMSVPEVESGLR